MRIALVELYGVGGTADYTGCIAQALGERGHEVAVITSSLFQPVATSHAYQVVRVFRYESSEPKAYKALKLARALRDAGHALRGLRPDVVHAQGTVIPGIERSFYRRLEPAVRVCTVHDVEGHEWRPWLGSLPRFYSAFDALICHSDSSRLRLSAQLPAMPVTVIPHGRYAPTLTPLPGRAESRAALGLPADAHIALLFGFVRRYKGLDLFLDAIGIARERHPEILGVVAGRPLYDIAASRHEAERRRLPVRWDLRFVPRDQMAQHFAAADVVVLPYTDTSDSGVIELAAGFGRPVVVTAAGGLAEAFRRYGAGAVVPPADPSALAEAMSRRYDPPTPSSVRGTSWEQVAASTESLYAQVLESRGMTLVRSAVA